jgi:hypothetical protein
MNECRCDERLKVKEEGSTHLVYGAPSRLRLIRKVVSLVRVLTTLDLRCEENTV